jgi:hypothetical protein
MKAQEVVLSFDKCIVPWGDSNPVSEVALIATLRHLVLL